MDRHDQELLDKQVAHIQPATPYVSTVIAVVLSVFFLGVIFGDLLSSAGPVASAPIQVASNDSMPTMAQLFGAPIRR
jgi:hypothetical protein